MCSPTWKKPKCPSTEEWINIPVPEYYIKNENEQIIAAYKIMNKSHKQDTEKKEAEAKKIQSSNTYRTNFKLI